MFLIEHWLVSLASKLLQVILILTGCLILVDSSQAKLSLFNNKCKLNCISIFKICNINFIFELIWNNYKWSLCWWQTPFEFSSLIFLLFWINLFLHKSIIYFLCSLGQFEQWFPIFLTYFNNVIPSFQDCLAQNLQSRIVVCRKINIPTVWICPIYGPNSLPCWYQKILPGCELLIDETFVWNLFEKQRLI